MSAGIGFIPGIEQFQGLVEQWNLLPEGNTKEIAKRKILEEAENDKE